MQIEAADTAEVGASAVLYPYRLLFPLPSAGEDKGEGGGCCCIHFVTAALPHCVRPWVKESAESNSIKPDQTACASQDECILALYRNAANPGVAEQVRPP